ncbi:hypothetical protein EJB05_07359 [Eragrostis curvula]|uniref:Proline-rich protein n=1 Tax=Eragrostis curvula TaxID=38414 RepID=A0A5J9WK57_9POAL|nr:hypothetical protein EJB05_07359 [Eragrostis curvula]
MKILARQLLLGVSAIVMAMGVASAIVHGDTQPVVVGLAKCADCTRKNMNAEAAFSGLQVAVKCKNSHGEYESKAVAPVEKSGAFSVPLAADLVGKDGKLKQDCFAQLHGGASSAPCPGQEPSKIVAAPSHAGQKKTFVALAGKAHRRSSPECASAFLCDPFIHHHNHHPVVVVPVPTHDDHGHSLPPVAKPPVTTVPEHKPPVTTVPVHEPPVATVPVHEPPSTPVYTPPKPTPIYHPPAQRDAVNDPQLFKKLFPFFKKKPFFFKFPFFPPVAQESKH